MDLMMKVSFWRSELVNAFKVQMNNICWINLGTDRLSISFSGTQFKFS